MIAQKTPPAETACTRLGLDHTGMQLLHLRANAVYHLPRPNAVLRLRHAPGNSAVAERLHTAITGTRWLADQGFPTITPLPLHQPISIDGWHATAWHYIAQPSQATPTPEDLGTMVRALHSLPRPPVPLPSVDPLGSLRADLHNLDASATAVDPHQRTWLLNQCDRIEQAFPALITGLDHGLLHGDAHTGNLFGAPGRWRLGDWDSISHGPRLQEAIPTLIGHHRFGRHRDRWLRFCRSYGLDPEIETTPAARLLRSARELRSLAAYIRAADHPAIHTELQRRLGSLMNNEPHTWQPI